MVDPPSGNDGSFGNIPSLELSLTYKSVSSDSNNIINLFYRSDKDELTHIIALTAHASKLTEEECLRIGMK